MGDDGVEPPKQEVPYRFTSRRTRHFAELLAVQEGTKSCLYAGWRIDRKRNRSAQSVPQEPRDFVTTVLEISQRTENATCHSGRQRQTPLTVTGLLQLDAALNQLRTHLHEPTIPTVWNFDRFPTYASR
jgi:hypothetical protein